MNQFDEIFNATLLKNHCIEVRIHKKYTNTFTKHFFLYCEDTRLCELSIADQRETNNHFIYILNNVPALTVGGEYKIFDDRYLNCYLNMNVLLKDDKICSLYYSDEVMGAHYHQYYTTFRVFSPLASKAYVVYVKDGIESTQALTKNHDTGIFIGKVTGNLANYEYYFIVRINGHLYSANDPYCRSLTSQSVRGVIINPRDVSVDLHNDCLKGFVPIEEAVIYELSVRDMTSFKNTSIRHKGKFLGLTETGVKTINNNPVGLDYIKDLGVTHVQILPIYDFCTICDEHPQEAYNWGYDPLYYNAPEGSYASNPKDPLSRIIDLKKMIASFHKAGIRVVMDVVYNHVFNLESSAFEKLCPSYYFKFREDGSPSNGSFCGNEFNSMHPMAKKFIIDSCLMWIKEYGIDGFRFDLMGLIDLDTINEIKTRAERIKPDFVIYGEGWDMPTTLPSDKMAKMQNSYKMPKIGFFNDRFRDVVKGKSSDYELGIKGYLTGDTDYIDGFKHCMLSSIIPLAFPPLFLHPRQSINYVECHDNATLYDKLKISNAYEDEESILRRIKIINAITIISYGVPFIHAGQEIALTKKGVHNSYNAGDHINTFNYDIMDTRIDMVESLKDFIKFKKNMKCLSLKTRDEIEKTISFRNIDFGALEIVYCGEHVSPHNEMKIIVNPTRNEFHFDLGKEMQILMDENGYLNETIYTNNCKIRPLSLIVAIS